MFLRDTSDILGRTAIEDAFGNRMTYGELETLSVEYEEVIPKRSLVMILCDYAIETVAFYYCQMNNHVVPMLVEDYLKAQLLYEFMHRYRPQFIWCSCKNRDLLGKDSKILMQKGEHFLVQMPYEFCKMNSELALLLTTSGSTGSLKFVRISYDNLIFNIKAFSEGVGVSEEDKAITVSPMHHCYGLTMLHMHWYVGACVCVTDYSILNIKFWECLKRNKVTNFAGVAYTYDILKQIDFFNQKYDSLRFLIQAGSKMSDTQQYFFATKLQERGIKFYVCYGQTEATGGISILSYKKVAEKIGSVGIGIHGITTSIVFDNDKNEGELVCKGKSICLGYAVSRKDLARGDDNQGYLCTGDIVYIDSDGDIFIRGRKTRFVKVLGVRVSLDELEAILRNHFLPMQMACTGKDNQIKIYYTEKGLENEILEFCREMFLIPRKMIECHFIEELPYTSNGKIKYADL